MVSHPSARPLAQTGFQYFLTPEAAETLISEFHFDAFETMDNQTGPSCGFWEISEMQAERLVLLLVLLLVLVWLQIWSVLL